ncbi:MULTISPECIES: PIN domain-containing protein [Pseudomonas aeruginosa group]|uniref:PIN domain-containing protein n=1 Tax=Pseudomonas aeruginosa group TaxID=136841 RepID=UPI00071BAAC8|nr:MULTISPECIES: PIN domain-containing protein [Pseudomonas aeruginosa group]KSD71899.1 PIN domain-containing protein [Pseudomonas aeruginosa]KSN94551.1 PIN domain-containing protein [Pseudomonas aeruginosa]MCT9632500.1 PIN domain-containing protein [Pseudomonas aeruginosa]MCW8033720.1 PIN domain-containing protein [Pseudomonas aeruginosa]
MRHSPFTAVYDANVLYPAPLRDLLMHLALTGVYRARWTAQIHDEWKRNLLINRRDLTQAQLDRTSAAMDRAIPDALVTGHEPLCPGLTLPDPDDRHVLAAAIKCSASVIVTFNLKDFPPDVLRPFEIEAVHPDDFIADLFDLDQAAVLEAVQAQRISLKSPPHTARELLDRLLIQGLTQSVKLLSEYERLI